MPAKKELNAAEAIKHLRNVYNTFISQGGQEGRFTIRHYNRLNKDSSMYIDVFVKKLGGWNRCLQKAGITLGFRQFREYKKEDISNYVKRVYQKFQEDNKSTFVHEGQEKTFRMRDFQATSRELGSQFSLAVVLKRFGSWSNILKELGIPIGRSRGLNQKEITDHVMKIYGRFRKSEGGKKIFSKEMYDKYNMVDDIYISSKLVERRFGTWLTAKKKMNIR